MSHEYDVDFKVEYYKLWKRSQAFETMIRDALGMDEFKAPEQLVERILYLNGAAGRYDQLAGRVALALGMDDYRPEDEILANIRRMKRKAYGQLMTFDEMAEECRLGIYAEPTSSSNPSTAPSQSETLHLAQSPQAVLKSPSENRQHSEPYPRRSYSGCRTRIDWPGCRAS